MQEELTTKDKIIVFILVISLTLVFTLIVTFISDTQQKPAKDFCKGDYIKGEGEINYCDGHPFLCNKDNNCTYVTVYESCRNTGKTNVCDVVKLNDN